MSFLLISGFRFTLVCDYSTVHLYVIIALTETITGPLARAYPSKSAAAGVRVTVGMTRTQSHA